MDKLYHRMNHLQLHFPLKKIEERIDNWASLTGNRGCLGVILLCQLGMIMSHLQGSIYLYSSIVGISSTKSLVYSMNVYLVNTSPPNHPIYSIHRGR